MRKFLIIFLALFLIGIKFSYAEHEGELGYCVLCDTVIMQRVDNYLKPNEEYREVWFEFSNGSIGKVGFCRKHSDHFTDKDYGKIMDGIKHGWEKEFKINKWDAKKIKEYKDTFFNITIRRKLDEKEIPTDD
jgi:hypothetical protein